MQKYQFAVQKGVMHLWIGTMTFFSIPSPSNYGLSDLKQKSFDAQASSNRIGHRLCFFFFFLNDMWCNDILCVCFKERVICYFRLYVSNYFVCACIVGISLQLGQFFLSKVNKCILCWCVSELQMKERYDKGEQKGLYT